jgi:hypothetical protein
VPMEALNTAELEQVREPSLVRAGLRARRAELRACMVLVPGLLGRYGPGTAA